MIRFTRASGPECPKCGCMDSRVVAHGKRWGRPWVRRLCDYCGRAFGAPDETADTTADTTADNPRQPPTPPPDAGVVYHVMRCPECESTNIKTTSTQRPTRYHKCRDCGTNFKSVEE